ncbi:DUF3858 domain-containing protein [Puia sp.]|jgi:hypothetical protein|uniref:DUF3858 domain-containing protein n=1 Tax=Puia sp. TaxID=2045100 RepID=UPI002F3E7DC5
MTIQNRCLLAFLVLFLFSSAVQAQEKIGKIPVKFGKVTPEDFNVNVESLDSSADAAVIADFGTTSFEGDSRGWFTLLFKRSKRIKIIKRAGFDAATVSIPLYVSGNSIEKIEGLRAVTYNLENGKVVETRLEDKSIFTDKLSKHFVVKKFTFPALKEGSIIEFTYTQSSPFLFNLQPWTFQGKYPCLWSEYQVEMPAFFEYVTLTHGFLPMNSSIMDTRHTNFNMILPGGAERDERFTYDDDVVTRRWVIRSIPAMKEEPFTTTIDNYLSRIEFQLRSYNFRNVPSKDIMGNWYSASESLLKDEDFGADLAKSNSWLDDSLRAITKGAGDNRQKAEKIYDWVRDNFTCTSHGSLYTSNPIRTTFKNRNGNEADLNLLLTAMLHHEKINADPVILSTRDNGFASEIYPLMTRFNYVVTRVRVDSSRLYLDASEPWLAFGKLPQRCYNGYSRVINEERPSYTILDPDSLTETKITLTFISRGGKGGLVAHVQSTPGFNEACVVREKVRADGEQAFMKKIQTSYSSEMAPSNLEIDSLKQPEQPLQIAYDVNITPDAGSELFYFNPLLAEGYKENPFKAAERKYPVEMPFSMDEMYSLTMEIPEGYTVDEIPKSAKVVFNDTEGYFEYLIVKGADNVQMRSRIKLKKATFKPEDYSSLRDFFAYIVKKQSEQIVFKKKK